MAKPHYTVSPKAYVFISSISQTVGRHCIGDLHKHFSPKSPVFVATIACDENTSNEYMNEEHAIVLVTAKKIPGRPALQSTLRFRKDARPRLPSQVPSDQARCLILAPRERERMAESAFSVAVQRSSSRD